MTTTKCPLAEPWNAAAIGAGLIFFVSCTWASYAHWANFEYRTFDLAYYLQAVWQLIHGHFDVSVLGVPLLGNHVEPIVLLMVPFFIPFRHPMVFVVVQNAALAAMAPLAFYLGRRIGLGRAPAAFLAIALLVTPATGYVALHEFHPEAFASPCLLLIIYARVSRASRLYGFGICALLACKENMALLLAAYCVVHLVLERRHPLAELWRWYLWPLGLSIIWFALCAEVVTPAFNSGAIDYGALYNRLGNTPTEIAANFLTEPHRIVAALGQALRNGNLLWALLIPFLGLPLLRPRWFLIATPILLQHLLSWRSSEWQIYFHYAAPLIPLFWIGTAEAVARIAVSTTFSLRIGSLITLAVLAACMAAQAIFGPAESIFVSVVEWSAGRPDRARKAEFIRAIPPAATVVAPLPYLSHLAMREKLYSLHYILKGLKTLSRSDYDPPPPTDFVLIDYNDSATFDPVAGYYHPAMKTADGRVIPSSDRLLHNFLTGAFWSAVSLNELTLYRKIERPLPVAQASASDPVAAPIQIDPYCILNGISKSGDVLSRTGLEITMRWSFEERREVFPWMLLQLTPRGGRSTICISRGLCAPEWPGGANQEKWLVIPTPKLPPGQYDAEALFMDYAKFLWAVKSPGPSEIHPERLVRVPLGQINVAPADPVGE